MEWELLTLAAVAAGYPGTVSGALFCDVEDQTFGILEEAWALSRVPISIIELVFFFVVIDLSITYCRYIVHIFTNSQIIDIILNCGVVRGASYKI